MEMARKGAQFLTAPTRDHTLRSGLGRSSNGRTRGSGPRSGGSSPPLPAICFRLTDVAPSSRGLGHGPLKAETRVRIPLGPPKVVGQVLAASNPPNVPSPVNA